MRFRFHIKTERTERKLFWNYFRVYKIYNEIESVAFIETIACIFAEQKLFSFSKEKLGFYLITMSTKINFYTRFRKLFLLVLFYVDYVGSRFKTIIELSYFNHLNVFMIKSCNISFLNLLL